MSIAPCAEIDDHLASLISYKARQLSRAKALRRYDSCDLEQELILGVLKRHRSFDPTRASLHTFVSVVIDRQALSLLRYGRAARRDHRRECHNQPAEVGRIDDGFVDAELRCDVHKAVATLEPHLRGIALDLMQNPPPDVARQRQLTRGQMRNRIASIKAHFIAKGVIR